VNDYTFVIEQNNGQKIEKTIKASSLLQAEDEAYASLQFGQYLVSVRKDY
jgi:hypothetical protein